MPRQHRELTVNVPDIVWLRGWARRVWQELEVASSIKIVNIFDLDKEVRRAYDKAFTTDELTAIFQIIQNWKAGIDTVPYHYAIKTKRSAIGLLLRELAKQINEGTETPTFIGEVEDALKELRKIPYDQPTHM